MNALIQIDYTNSRPTVLGRDLHKMLEVDTRYNDWFKRMCEYGFADGTDYQEVLLKNEINPQGGRPATEHQITIAMAKELCMLQRSDKGKQARQYFIAIEEAWNQPEAIMARALQISDRKIKSLESKIEQDKPAVFFAANVAASDDTILVRDLAKLIKQSGKDIGEKRLYEWLRGNGYLIKSGSDRNSPTQKSMDMQLFVVREATINTGNDIRLTRCTRVTGRGQMYFINKLAACTAVR